MTAGFQQKQMSLLFPLLSLTLECFSKRMFLQELMREADTASGMSLREPWPQNTHPLCPIVTRHQPRWRGTFVMLVLSGFSQTAASLFTPLAPPRTEGPTFIGPRLSHSGAPGRLGAASQGQQALGRGQPASRCPERLSSSFPFGRWQPLHLLGCPPLSLRPQDSTWK